MRVFNRFCGHPGLVLDRHDAMVGSQPEATNPVSPDGAEPLVAKAGFPIDAAGEARTMPAKQPREEGSNHRSSKVYCVLSTEY